MSTTERLFDADPYAEKFTAQVIDIADDHIVLDRTLFYPLSGNQQYDTGTLNGIPVTAVYVDESDEGYLSFEAPIRHVVADPGVFTPGQTVTGVIDKVARLKTMRLHTASHIIAQLVSALPGFLSSEGSFVNAEKDRMDFKFSINLDAQAVAALEKQVNAYLAQAYPVTFEMRDGVRIWQCNGVEMPCCGTHVANTQEIGPLKLKRKNQGKGVNRIETRPAD